MGGTECRTKHRHRLTETELMCRHAIGVAFHNQCPAGLFDALLGGIETVQNLVLGKERRVRRVQILAVFVPRVFTERRVRHKPSAECHGASLFIPNGKDEATAKEVVPLLLAKVAYDLQHFYALRSVLGFIDEPVSVERSVADFECLDGIGSNIPPLEIFSNDGGFVGVEQCFVIDFGNPVGNVKEFFSGKFRFTVGSCGRFGEFWQLNAGFIGEYFEGFAEIDIFDFHDEGEDIPADVADPAFEGLPVGIDGQTGFGVIVPGTATDVVSPCSAKGNVVSHEFDDVHGIANAFLDGVLIVSVGHAIESIGFL